jgi:hypothetical protein
MCSCPPGEPKPFLINAGHQLDPGPLVPCNGVSIPPCTSGVTPIAGRNESDLVETALTTHVTHESRCGGGRRLAAGAPLMRLGITTPLASVRARTRRSLRPPPRANSNT